MQFFYLILNNVFEFIKVMITNLKVSMENNDLLNIVRAKDKNIILLSNKLVSQRNRLIIVKLYMLGDLVNN